MSYAKSTLEVCPDIQMGLYNGLINGDPAMVRDRSPFWDFLWSDANMSGFQQMIVPGNSKVATVVVTYDQRILESEVEEINDGTTLNCTATKKRGNLSASYTIDPNDMVEASELMDAADWINVCESNPSIVFRKVRKLINSVQQKLATRLVTRAITLNGKWSADVDGTVVSDELIVKTYKDGTTDPFPYTWQNVDFALNQMSFTEAPTAIICGSQFYKYAQFMESGCCSSNGLDIGDLAARFGKAVMYDKRVNKAEGSDGAWIIKAGSLIPLYYTFNNNQLSESASGAFGSAIMGSNYIKGVIQDPETGFPMDWLVSDNCGKVSIIVRGNADVQTLPSDMFAPGDDFEGVTGFVKLKVTNV